MENFLQLPTGARETRQQNNLDVLQFVLAHLEEKLVGLVFFGERGIRKGGSGCFMTRHLFDDRLVPIPLYPWR